MVRDWTTEFSDGKVTCDDCGLEYTLYYQQFPMRERGTCNCKCGKELYRYNGSRHYSIRQSEAREVEKKPDDEQPN